MDHTMRCKAPCGMPLKLVTIFSLLILGGIPLLGLFSGPRSEAVWIISMIIMPLTILVISACFTIRGYTLHGNMLFIHRLGWNSVIDLSRLVSDTMDPKAMTKSIRTFGNGGMFCFAGLF